MRLVYLTFGWVAGILLAASSDARSPALWLLLSLLTVGLLVWVRHERLLRWFVAALLLLMLGALRFDLMPLTSDVAAYNNAGGLTLTGQVAAEPDRRDDRVQLRLAAESVIHGGETTPVSGVVLVRAPRDVDVRYGDSITATGRLITPAEFDTFSYADFLARQQIFSIMPNAAVDVRARDGGNSFTAALLRVKDRARAAIAAALPEPQASLLTGILLGDERGIAPEVEDAFAATGAAHVIAISGFNMVILSRVIYGSLRGLGVPVGRAALIGMGVIGLYTLFVGANAAVVRAALMSGLLLVAEAIGRRTYVPASLAFATIVLSLINPTVLWDISFQLSLFATLGLALFADPLSTRFNRLLQYLFPASAARRVGGFLAEPLVASIAAQVFVLPLIALYFGRLSLVTLPVNLLIVPVQALILIIGGLATLLALIAPGPAQGLYWLALLPLGWTTSVVRAFAVLPFADVAFTIDPRLVTGGIALALAGAVAHATQPDWLRRLSRLVAARSVLVAVLAAGVGLLVLLGAVYRSRPDGMLHVHLLDLGHSNAVLAQTPDGAHILIDGGRFPSRLLTALGDRLPFNDRTIELLIITQPDENEFGALTAVLNRYDVGVALTNGQPNESDAWLDLQTALAPHDVVPVRAGYTVDFSDGTRLEVLHPVERPELGASLDDNALVLRLSYGEVSFLLTSDMSAAAQRDLMARGGWVTATVLQLPAHGAAASLAADFLAMAQPSALVVQIDPANRRGDPNPDTLALLPPDVPLLRTDEQGALHLWTDGVDLWVVGSRRGG